MQKKEKVMKKPMFIFSVVFLIAGTCCAETVLENTSSYDEYPEKENERYNAEWRVEIFNITDLGLSFDKTQTAKEKFFFKEEKIPNTGIE